MLLLLIIAEALVCVFVMALLLLVEVETTPLSVESTIITNGDLWWICSNDDVDDEGEWERGDNIGLVLLVESGGGICGIANSWQEFVNCCCCCWIGKVPDMTEYRIEFEFGDFDRISLMAELLDNLDCSCRIFVVVETFTWLDKDDDVESEWVVVEGKDEEIDEESISDEEDVDDLLSLLLLLLVLVITVANFKILRWSRVANSNACGDVDGDGGDGDVDNGDDVISEVCEKFCNVGVR